MNNGNPICSSDLKECARHQAISESGTANCHNCDRFNDGVKTTEAIPEKEIKRNVLHRAYNCIRNVFIFIPALIGFIHLLKNWNYDEW